MGGPQIGWLGRAPRRGLPPSPPSPSPPPLSTFSPTHKGATPCMVIVVGTPPLLGRSNVIFAACASQSRSACSADDDGAASPGGDATAAALRRGGGRSEAGAAWAEPVHGERERGGGMWGERWVTRSEEERNGRRRAAEAAAGQRGRESGAPSAAGAWHNDPVVRRLRRSVQRSTHARGCIGPSRGSGAPCQGRPGKTQSLPAPPLSPPRPVVLLFRTSSACQQHQRRQRRQGGARAAHAGGGGEQMCTGVDAHARTRC